METVASRITRHFLPSEAFVLGERLTEFTLWHWSQLAAFESPYADLAYGMDFADLAIAVRICSARPLSRIDLRSSLKWRIRKWLFQRGAIEHEETFFNWMSYHLRGPAKWNKGETSELRCPAWLFLASRLIRLGFTEREAWRCTPGRARAYLAASDIIDGAGDFLNDKEVDSLITESGYTMEDLGLE